MPRRAPASRRPGRGSRRGARARSWNARADPRLRSRRAPRHRASSRRLQRRGLPTGAAPARRPIRSRSLSKPFGAGTGNSWQLEILEDDRVSLSGGDPHSLRSPDPIPPGQGRHVAGRWDGNEKELFIDGVEVIEVDATVEYDAHAIYLGGDQNGGTEVLHWEGVLDDLRVYNRALSDSESEDPRSSSVAFEPRAR